MGTNRGRSSVITLQVLKAPLGAVGPREVVLGSSDTSNGGGSLESGEGGGHEAVPSQTPHSMESEDVSQCCFS